MLWNHRMKTHLKALLVTLVLGVVALTYWAITHQSNKKIIVAVDAPLVSRQIFDPSDMDAARFYFEETPDSQMTLKEIFYDFEPSTSSARFEAAIKEGVPLFVTTQPSSTLTASSHLFAAKGPLLLNTSATSPLMTGKDDFILRIIPDAKQEQMAIADFINTLPSHGQLLVLQDSNNSAYTDPAYRYFAKQLGQTKHWTITPEKFPFDRFRPESFDALMAEAFDAMYLLGGDFQASMGNMAQLFYQHHPDKPIVLTAWARSNAIYETSGPAIDNMVLLGHHPAKGQDPAIADYLSRFKQRFGYQPMAMALLVRQALEILEQAIKAGHTEPADIRQYLLEQPVLTTTLGTISFDAFGDVKQSLHPIKHLNNELR
jgi:branched-chain amino acid transport system substrate-binding protein